MDIQIENMKNKRNIRNESPKSKNKLETKKKIETIERNKMKTENESKPWASRWKYDSISRCG